MAFIEYNPRKRSKENIDTEFTFNCIHRTIMKNAIRWVESDYDWYMGIAVGAMHSLYIVMSQIDRAKAKQVLSEYQAMIFGRDENDEDCQDSEAVS